jgi:hypothetical protein
MFRRRVKRSKVEQAATDGDVAQAMRELAEIFVERSAHEGYDVGWGADSAQRLDELCDAFLASRPEQSVIDSMIMAMGAYLGELIVRNAGGRWTYNQSQAAVVVETQQQPLLCFPHNKVAKRLRHGEEHGLWAFYEYAAIRKVPQRAQTTLLEPD